MNKNLEACNTAEVKIKTRMKYEKRIQNFELKNSTIFGNKSKLKTKYNFILYFTDQTKLIVTDLDQKLDNWIIGEICNYQIDENGDLMFFKIEQN